jgi:hypothetical protein
MTAGPDISRDEHMSRTTLRVALMIVTIATLSACGNESGGTSSPTAATPLSPAPPVSGFTMRGTVSDTVFRPLAGATVEVVSGPQTGLRTVSDGRGEFGFAGEFDDTSTFQATKDGFATATLPLGPYCEPCRPNRWVHFGLATLTEAVDISGSYEMTVNVASSCTSIPAELRSRTYQANIPSPASGGNGYVPVRVTGADFVPGWDGVEIGVAGTDVGLWSESLLERVSPTNFLIIGVSAAGVVPVSHPQTVSLQASGRIAYCTVAAGATERDCFGNTARPIVCDSSGHSIVFTRR